MGAKNVIVTGGASGIGFAIATELLRRSYHVVIVDVVEKNIETARATLDGYKLVSFRTLDVTDEAAVINTVEDVAKELGDIHGLVNSAGIGREATFLETNVEAFRKILDVNLIGTFLMCREVARTMKETGGGSIVNVASVSGIVGNIYRSAYGASKAGVIHMTRVMAVELAKYGIRANTIAPGPIETPMVKAMHSAESRAEWTSRIPQRRYGQPEELAGAAVFLLDDDLSGYITGQVLCVDGGFTAGGLIGALEAPTAAARHA